MRLDHHPAQLDGPGSRIGVLLPLPKVSETRWHSLTHSLTHRDRALLFLARRFCPPGAFSKYYLGGGAVFLSLAAGSAVLVSASILTLTLSCCVALDGTSSLPTPLTPTLSSPTLSPHPLTPPSHPPPSHPKDPFALKTVVGNTAAAAGSNPSAAVMCSCARTDMLTPPHSRHTDGLSASDNQGHATLASLTRHRSTVRLHAFLVCADGHSRKKHGSAPVDPVHRSRLCVRMRVDVGCKSWTMPHLVLPCLSGNASTWTAYGALVVHDPVIWVRTPHALPTTNPS